MPAVATVRDYWPVCYWSDLLHTREGLALCPACTTGNMRICIRPRAGALWPLALPMIPYMRANLAAKRSGLARAGRGDRRQPADRCRPHGARARAVADTHRGHPERGERGRACGTLAEVGVGVGVARSAAGALRALRRQARAEQGHELTWSTSSAQADLDWPLVVAGDGPDRAALERAAKASGRRIEFTGWVDKAEAAQAARRCVDADLSVARTRIAEPRADRSERARHSDRRDGHGRHARHRRARRHRIAVGVARGARGRRPPARGRTRRFGAGSARRRRTQDRARVRRRRPSSRASSACTRSWRGA